MVGASKNGGTQGNLQEHYLKKSISGDCMTRFKVALAVKINAQTAEEAAETVKRLILRGDLLVFTSKNLKTGEEEVFDLSESPDIADNIEQ